MTQRFWRSIRGSTVDLPDVLGMSEFVDLKKEARALADLPMKDVLLLSVYLDHSSPTNTEIVNWNKTYGITVKMAEQYFGPEGKRFPMTTRFLSEYEMIRRFADQYAPRTAKNTVENPR